MTGTPASAPSPAIADVTSLDADALRARLALAEASLTQTCLDLSTAQRAIATRDAAPPALREAEAGGGNCSGAGLDGPTAPPRGARVAPGGTAAGEATGGAPALVLPAFNAGRTAADYEPAADGDGASDATSDYRGLFWSPRGNRRGAGRAEYRDDWAVEGTTTASTRSVLPRQPTGSRRLTSRGPSSSRMVCRALSPPATASLTQPS